MQLLCISPAYSMSINTLYKITASCRQNSFRAQRAFATTTKKEKTFTSSSPERLSIQSIAQKIFYCDQTNKHWWRIASNISIQNAFDAEMKKQSIRKGLSEESTLYIKTQRVNADLRETKLHIKEIEHYLKIKRLIKKYEEHNMNPLNSKYNKF